VIDNTAVLGGCFFFELEDRFPYFAILGTEANNSLAKLIIFAS